MQNAAQTRAEVLASPIENAKEINPADIGVQAESSEGDELIVILREGELPAKIDEFCRQIFEQCPFISFGNNSKIYVQQIINRSVSAGGYVATHAVLLSDYYSLGVPELESLEFIELQDQDDAQCLVYVTDFEKKPSDAAQTPQKPKSGPCFVATAVYGSYDAPQVRILRKFRDEVLAKSKAGRMFIHVYYLIGPAISKPLKKYSRIRSAARFILNYFVSTLRRL
jgi:hypothetical protein